MVVSGLMRGSGGAISQRSSTSPFSSASEASIIGTAFSTLERLMMSPLTRTFSPFPSAAGSALMAILSKTRPWPGMSLSIPSMS